VLIPRPDTEALVQRALQMCRTESPRELNILDVGTGSGCIAVSIAKFAANARLVATDISAEAIAVARCNVDKHGLADRVRAVRADLFDFPAEFLPPGGFDLMVSNPPYVPQPVWDELPPHIRDHEPRIALTPGPEGIELHRRLAAEAPSVLAPGGTLLVEIGSGQSCRASAADPLSVLPELFEAQGGWRFVRSHRDPCDPHERVLEFVRK
jgi:release factor glutamine methyltransferase